MSTMILRPKSPLRRHVTLPGAAPAAPTVAVTSWLRKAVEAAQTVEDAALATGAAIAMLDAVVRRDEQWAGVWRQRLALAAAAATARQAGRVEDEAALRDAVLFARPGDILSGSTTLGPAGLLLVAWRRLAARPAEALLTKKSLAAVLEEFGFFARDGAAVSDLADALRRLATTEGAVGMLTGAYAAIEGHGLPRAMGPWLADALLAQRLGWSHAVPLLGGEAFLGVSARPRRAAATVATSGIEMERERAKGLLAAQARAALRAIELAADLGRPAERLLAVAPKLRAKEADHVVDHLSPSDAVAACH
ncbi:DUF1403 family protein [Mesorhizobium sp. M0663]|uniref:DUF1403 family protein n=1 Tax=Mesorhizobium sp. M0663 TaxID=2956981 RepID=UPI00333978B5